MNQLTNKINELSTRFSFSRKLALTFFICSLLTFVVIDIILHILYSKIIVTTHNASIFNTEAFSQFSNNQILSSTKAWIKSGLAIFQQMLFQMGTTYAYFKSNPNASISNEKQKINPGLTQTFLSPTYNQTGIYFHNQYTQFKEQPYIDKVMASVSTKHFPTFLKRINVIYITQNNFEDLLIRTVPATNDFMIPSFDAVARRFQQLGNNSINFTSTYYDQYSKANNLTELVAIRFLMPISKTLGYRMMIEIQLEKAILDFALSYTYSFPQTQIYLIAISKTTKKMTILGQNKAFSKSIDISLYTEPGSKNITIGGYQFLVTTVSLLFSPGDIDADVAARLITFLNKSETSIPNTVLDQFLSNQYSILIEILYGGTFILMLVISSIGVAIGNIIFSYFSLIRKKCKQYLINPLEIKQIDAQINQQINKQIPFGVELEARNQQLLENVISIMHNIQAKKMENRKKYKINFDNYPLNPLGINFQQRMKIRDYQRFQAIGRVIQESNSME